MCENRTIPEESHFGPSSFLLKGSNNQDVKHINCFLFFLSPCSFWKCIQRWYNFCLLSLPPLFFSVHSLIVCIISARFLFLLPSFLSNSPFAWPPTAPPASNFCHISVRLRSLPAETAAPSPDEQTNKQTD